MATMKEIQEELVSDFSFYDDWMDKYEYIISLGKELKEFPEESRSKDLLIKGCQSQVWLLAEYKDGRLSFKADSDAIIAKGIISLLLQVFNDRTPDEILSDEIFFVDEIGLTTHLSPNRSNGLVSMIKQIKIYALVYKEKGE